MGKTAAGLLLAGAALLSYEENNRLSETRLHLSFAGLPKAFDGFTIVQLSDLHNKRFGQNQIRILRQVEALEPDVICITGDLIDKRRTTVFTMGDALELCRGALRFAPVYYVPGNHEASFPMYPFLKKQMKSMGVQVLENQAAILYRGRESLRIAGVDDPKFFGERKTKQMQNLIQATGQWDGIFTVLLSHRPEELENYSVSGADLVLTGHAHGGQFRIPKIGPVYVPNQGFFPPLAQGVHQCGKTTMVISRGLGNSAFPQRIFNRPEIVRVVLTCPKSPE